MAHPDPEMRRQYGRLGADISWARTPVRAERTAPARAALEEKWLREVPDTVTDPEERRKAASSARKAYYRRLSLAGVEARRRRREGLDPAA